MNVAVLNLKFLTKNLVKLVIIILLIIMITRFFSFINNSSMLNNLTRNIKLEKCIGIYTSLMIPTETLQIAYNPSEILSLELPILNEYQQVNNGDSSEGAVVVANAEESKNESIVISKTATTESVSDKNIEETYTTKYKTVKIRNQSDYELTKEMLTPDVTITNSKEFIIFHTHTCESYTATELNNYKMTGNYRTTDLNFNVARVGTELENQLEARGFEVTHSTTYHDYPAYNGSYERSLETVNKLLKENKDVQFVIDLHRDAVGKGDTYGPTVKINGESVAQLMFVIGTDGGGLEHPNWLQNLKMAIKIQEKANEMYPGLFRPIILRNSRYNQHVTTGASIIEVGATANTLEECLLSMQCLSNVFEELCR